LRYLVEGKNNILLDEANTKKYIGKYIKLRSPMFCKSDDICSICSGELYKRLDITNIGLTVNIVGTTILNRSMKLFHDTTVKVNKFDINDSYIEL